MKEGYKMTELGEIPVDWEVVSFIDVMVLQRGFDLPVQERKSGSIPLIASNGIIDTHNEYKVLGPTIVTGRSGTIGKVYYEERNSWPLNTTLYVKDFKSNYPKFLYYFLSSFNLEQFGTGTGVPTLNRNIVHAQKVSIPPLAEQQKIATILSTVDEKIEVIEAQITQTQELKKGLMQKLLTEGIGHTRFKDSPLGRIPENWEVVNFGDIAVNVTSKFPFDFGKCVDLEHITQNTGTLLGFSEISSKSSVKNHFQKNDTLFGKLRPYLKKFWFADFEGGCSSELLIFRPKENTVPKYIFYTVQLDSFIENSVSKSFGTKMPRTSWSIVKEFFLAIPSREEQIQIVDILSNVDEKLVILESKKQHFQDLKKGLMQQLLTGKIRVLPIEVEVPQ